MTRTCTISAALALIAGAAHAAPTADFSDADFITETANAGTISTGILTDLDGPIVMLAGAPESPTHLKPAKPGQPGLSADDTGKDFKAVVVPLPAPAGLAIAGLLLVGTIRRR